MSSIFGALGRDTKPKGPDLALRVQSSVEGRVLPIGAGQNRYSGNLIWYGDFLAIPDNGSDASGGKGGIFSGKGNTQQYKYSASFMISLGEQISAVQMISNSSQYDFFYTPSAEIEALLTAKGITITSGNTYGMTLLPGDFASTGWSYLNSAHPDQALNYRGEAAACFPNLGLGTNPTLPNFNFEILWPVNTAVAAFGPDASPADWVSEFLTNGDWGLGFPSALLDDLSDYDTWAKAASLLISPVLTSAVSAQSHLGDVMAATSADFFWDDGILTVLPYADATVTGNGFTYTPDVTPLYEFTENELLPVEHGPQTGDEATAVRTSTMDPTTVNNVIPLSYLSRGNLYNPVTVYAANDPLIAAAGRRQVADPKQYDFLCTPAAASAAVNLLMKRTGVLQQFFFHIEPQFVLVKPMSLVSLTAPRLGLDAQVVRVTEVIRNDDLSFSVTAEEFLGVPHPPLYTLQEPLGAGYNVNEDPGGTITPIFFEPTYAEANGLEVWMAIAGADLTIWGGAKVWVATDAAGTYQMVGTISGSARMGVTTADFPSVTEAASGQTIDNVNTLSVDLTESLGDLASGSLADMTALNTACYVGGEVIAYQTATLTAANKYDLAPSVRGAYGSTIADHPAGSAFVRLDGQIFRLPYTADRVGGQLYVKLQSYNKYAGGLQDLADVDDPYTYTITGSALTVPLADVTDLRATYKDNTSNIIWTEVSDFRTPRYEIRVGTDWETGLSFGTVAHPPFTVFTDGTYWVKAVVEPAPNLIVYSTDAVSVTLAGTVLNENVLTDYDEAALGWTGTITGPGAIVGGDFVTTVSGTVAYYQEPTAHFTVTRYDRPIRLSCSWQAVGVPVNDDFLGNPDILNDPDILSASASRYVDSWVEILLYVGDADVFALPDVFDPPDVFDAIPGTVWVRYAPGSVVGHAVGRRLAIISSSDSVTATATAFRNIAGVDTRIDHKPNYALGAPGETFTFRPDGASADAAFQGGPNSAVLPLVRVDILNQSQGDYWVPSGLSLSQVTIQCFNAAGVGVARTVNITVEGY